MNDILNPDNLAHQRTASSLDYKDWDFNDVFGWLEDHLKLAQYKETFCKFKYNSDVLFLNFKNFSLLSLETLGIDGSLLDHITD